MSNGRAVLGAAPERPDAPSGGPRGADAVPAGPAHRRAPRFAGAQVRFVARARGDATASPLRTHRGPAPRVPQDGRPTAVLPVVRTQSPPPVPHQIIANGIAQVYKDLYGRGPVKIVATILPDTVFVVLEKVNTPGQNRLVDLDEVRLLTEVHLRLQRAIAPDLVAVVEGVLERRVRSYVPGYNGDDNTATDTFLLEPRPREA